MALQLLKQAFTTDVAPILAMARQRAGGAIDPVGAYRASGYRKRKAEERPGGRAAGRRHRLIRKAFKMSVHQDQHEEYARRHNPIWKDLEDTLLAHGVKSYSIFLDHTTSELFAYAEIESEERWKAIAATPVCKRWWTICAN